MVQEHSEGYPSRRTTIVSNGIKPDVKPEILKNWIRWSHIDNGQRPVLSTHGRVRLPLLGTTRQHPEYVQDHLGESAGAR
jgi:hypothetical protein